jgi:hypothetical protein
MHAVCIARVVCSRAKAAGFDACTGRPLEQVLGRPHRWKRLLLINHRFSTAVERKLALLIIGWDEFTHLRGGVYTGTIGYKLHKLHPRSIVMSRLHDKFRSLNLHLFRPGGPRYILN